MQLLVTGFSKLLKRGFSRPENTQKLSAPSSKQRVWEALDVQVVTLCYDSFLPSKGPLFKRNYPSFNKWLSLSRIHVAHEIRASRISLQVASTAGRTKRHCGIATDLGHCCGFVFNVSAAVRPMTTLMGCCSVVCPRRGGVQHGSWGRGFLAILGMVFSLPAQEMIWLVRNNLGSESRFYTGRVNVPAP